MTEEIMNAINSEVYGVWFLIGAALVFWMQAGFAMVEAGFTRAKNTGNIIMKNLMDFNNGTRMIIQNAIGMYSQGWWYLTPDWRSHSWTTYR